VEGTGGVGSASNPPAIPNTGIPPLPAAAFFESLPGPVQVINNLVGQGPSQFAALNAAAPVFNTVLGGIRLPPQQQPPRPPRTPASTGRSVLRVATGAGAGHQ